jgi:DNA-binding HxlR family transcriptional regulator
MALLDLLGRRQALRVVWELREARLSFRALQDACGGVSPTVLNQRLKELRECGLVELSEGEGYGLTPLGHQLRQALGPLREWSEERWASAMRARTRA